MDKKPSKTDKLPARKLANATPAKHAGGRPQGITQDVARKIVAHFASGKTRDEAAAAAGYTSQAFARYLRLGAQEPTGPWGWLPAAVQAADAEWRSKKAVSGLRRRQRDAPGARVAHLARVLTASPDAVAEEVADLVLRAATDPGAATDLEARALQACRDHLLPFAAHTYQGNRPHYRVSWHHRVLAALFERMARGELRRMLVSLPPRHGKTELMRAMSAWILGCDPDARIVSGAYSARLAGKSSKAIRRVVASEAFREVFPDVRLPDRREVMSGEYTLQGMEWELAGGSRGGYYASGLSGSVTGSGGGYILVDDPCKNRQEAESALYQDTVFERYQDDWASRREMPDCRLVMATRWGDRDLIGQLIERSKSDPAADQWEVVNIPALLETEDDRYPGDPRALGDPLCPDLYLQTEEWDSAPPAAELRERAVKDLAQLIHSTIGGEALYQGRAVRREGGIVKEDWTKNRWTKLPAGEGEWVQTWDPKASSSKRPWASYTVGQVWFRPQGSARCYLVDERRAKVGIDEAIHLLHELTDAWPLATLKLIERKGYGGTLIDLCKAPHAVGGQQYAGIPGMVPVNPCGDKVTRLEAVVPLLSAGNVVLPDSSQRSWVADWVREVTRFTGRPTDVADRVDAMSQCLDRWKTVSQPFRYSAGGARASASFR